MSQDHQHQMSSLRSPKMWRYQVIATLLDQESVDHYLDWLLRGHVAAVCAWADHAEVVQLQGSDLQKRSTQVMSVYWFASREEFDRYEREGAPLLRAEGIELADQLGGITFERTLGWSQRVEGQG